MTQIEGLCPGVERLARVGYFAHFGALKKVLRPETPSPELIQMTSTYPAPVDQLLVLGEPGPASEWRDYRALGLADEHVPALVTLVEDPRLSWLEWKEGDHPAPYWAPLHAWRALGQLGAASSAEALVRVLVRNDEDDWAASDIPRVLAMIGPLAAAPVLAALPEAARLPEPWMTGQLGEALVQIARAHPETRDQAVDVLTRQLRMWPDQAEEVNGFLVWDLLELEAVEAAPVMREAFEANAVDESMVGDWEDVQVALGLLAERTTPQPRYNFELSDRGRRVRTPAPIPIPGSTSAAAKARQLRKAQKQAAKKKRRK
ncbi:MAG TPA: hypothetical protein VFT45_00155 [Longimicrobium sp.]|nr:hypothetical protein [Longimicrobium sp.]